MSAVVYEFAVVTKVPEPVEVYDDEGALIGMEVSRGNMALGSSWTTSPDNSSVAVWRKSGQMPLAPVFHVGEILLMGADDREVLYPGRKPSKWDIEVEYVDTLDKAVALSRRITGMDRY